MKPREEAFRDVSRIIVKVGSSSLLGDGDPIARISEDIATLISRGIEVILVSSGAIAFGMRRLEMTARPSAIEKLQAAAAVGQSALIRRWEEEFSAREIPVAQLLLTHADFADRTRYLNARRAIDALLSLGAFPIVNENDTVSVEEIQFGDNDQLAAMLTDIVGADLLILLTDVPGLLDREGQRVSELRTASEAMPLLRAPKSGGVGSGGMRSKVLAAEMATRRGAAVVIGPAGEANVASRILAGEDLGTLVLPDGSQLASRKHWIAYTLRPAGALQIDEGAAAALERGASLLAAGVVGCEGAFKDGDAIRISCAGAECARGLVRFSAEEVRERLESGERENLVLVHRDDLTLLNGRGTSGG